MATAERRRRRVLNNSEERFQKILGLRCHHSPEDSSVSEVDLTHKPEKELNADPSGKLKDVDGGSQNVVESVGTRAAGGVESDSQKQEEWTRSLSADSDQPVVPAEPPNRWIRPILNSLLAVLLLARWTYLNFDTILARDAGKNKSGQRDDLGEATKTLVNESIIWPFIALQLALLCGPQLRQTTHSPRISMLTVALQLSGIPVKLTKFLSLVISSVLATLSDLCFFMFAVVLFHELIITVAPFL